MTCSRDDAVERSFKGPPSRERVDHPPIRVLEEGRKLLEVQYRSIFILLRRLLGAANLVDCIEWTSHPSVLSNIPGYWPHRVQNQQSLLLPLPHSAVATLFP